MRRTCRLCGYVGESSGMRRLRSTSKGPQIILVASLSFTGEVEKWNINGMVENISSSNAYICHTHFIHAAQYLCAELVASGKRISYCDDPRPGEANAYVTTADIPTHLVEVINAVSNNAGAISARDVWSFVNEALKRYYGTESWPAHQEEEEEEVRLEEAVSVQSEDEVMSLAPSEPELETESAPEEDVEMMEEYETDDDVASVGEDQGSEYEPDSSDSESSSAAMEDLGQTESADLQKYFLVKGERLLKLFRFCPECGGQLDRTRLRAVGTAAVVRFICGNCSVRKPRVKRWESQDRVVPHSRERKFKGNVVAAVAAITTGLRFAELSRWAEQANLAMFSKTFFYEVFQWTKPAIRKVYQSQQRMVLDEIRRKYEEGEGLHLAADGAYDSRGYSAMIGKVVLSDLRTNLILHCEVLHRSETEDISTRMEVEGMKRLLRWVGECGFRVSSLTTDRNRSIGAMLRDLEPELGAIRHYYDGWHLMKWLGNELRKAAKVSGCGKIDMWTEKTKTWLWQAFKTASESGADPRAFFNSCLNHVVGVHRWPRDPLTGPYTRCSHAPLQGPRPQELDPDSKAYEAFRRVLLTRSFQTDIAQGSPYGGTSICEAKNALDRMYCPKEIFFPIRTYPLHNMMATMHMNTLRLAELSGERRVLKRVVVQRKYLDRTSTLVLKTPAKHVWRDFVLKEVLEGRLIHLQSKGPSGSPQWVVDLMEEEEDYELEL